MVRSSSFCRPQLHASYFSSILVSCLHSVSLSLSLSSRHAEQLALDAAWSSRPERLSDGSLCRWHGSLHAGSQLHHRHHLSGLRLCALSCHGTPCVLLFLRSVFALSEAIGEENPIGIH